MATTRVYILVIDLLERTCKVDNVPEILVQHRSVGRAIQYRAASPVIALDGKPFLTFSFGIHFR